MKIPELPFAGILDPWGFAVGLDIGTLAKANTGPVTSLVNLSRKCCEAEFGSAWIASSGFDDDSIFFLRIFSSSFDRFLTNDQQKT